MLPASPRAASLARSFVTAWWRERRLVGDLDDLLLMTSELVTNAVRHGSGQRTVGISRGPGSVRVDVTDSSTGAPVHQSARINGQSGRGLALVHALSLDTGHEPRASGKSVWFTITASQPARRAAGQ